MKMHLFKWYTMCFCLCICKDFYDFACKFSGTVCHRCMSDNVNNILRASMLMVMMFVMVVILMAVMVFCMMMISMQIFHIMIMIFMCMI